MHFLLCQRNRVQFQLPCQAAHNSSFRRSKTSGLRGYQHSRAQTRTRARTYTFFLKWDLSTKQGSSGYDQICLPHKPSIHSTSSSSGNLQKCLKSQAPVSEHVFQTRDTTKDSSYGTPILTTLDLEGWPYVLFHSALERRRLCSQRPDSSSIKKKKMPATAHVQPSFCSHSLAFCMPLATHLQPHFKRLSLSVPQPPSLPASYPRHE